MNAVNTIDDGLASRATCCSYDDRDKAMASRRKAAFRGLLGLAGAETPLDDLLASVMVEGDRFATWARGGEPLRNTRSFYRLGGTLLPIERGSGNSHVVEMHDDSQLEVWECDENSEPSFPLYRLPFSTINGRKHMRIVEDLRTDVCLVLDAKALKHDVSLELSFDHDPVSIARHRQPKKLQVLNTAQGLQNVLSDISETVLDHGRVLRVRMAELLNTAFAFRAVRSEACRQIDVRNDRLYRLGDMIRPAIIAV